MRRWLLPVAVLVVVLLGVGAVAAYFVLYDAERARLAKPEMGMEDMRIPEFTMVDQDGNERTEEIFEDQITILDFSFTHCPFVCPAMNAQMAYLQHRLKGSGVRFVSISVDPERDTPERLRQYAGEIGADLSTWTFLTGDEQTVERIVKDALGFDLMTNDQDRIKLPDGSEMANVIHPSRIMLVDERRGVIGMYTYDFEPDVENLEQRARILATR